MAVEVNPNEIYLGRGKIFVDRYDKSGNSTGLRFLGEASKLELTPSVEKKELYTKTKASAPKIVSLTTQQTHTLAIDFQSFTPENIALVLLGDTVAIDQDLSIVSDEVITTSLIKGAIYRTDFTKITGLTLTSGVTPMVLGTDYEEFDALNGMIRILPTTTLAPGAPVSAAYTSPAMNKVKVTGGTSANILLRLLFIGDPTNGARQNLEVWRLQITPSAAIGLITDDFAVGSLSGEVLADSLNHPESPLYDMTVEDYVTG